MKSISWKRLLIAVGISLFAGVIGSVFTTNAIPTWYMTLVKPDFNPPNWLFAPVWTILYVLMGIALYLVWTSESGDKIKRAAIWFFSLQLILNTFWSVVFFGLQNIIFGFVIIIALWISIAMTMLVFKRVSYVAFWLLVPYLLWVTFASVLNGAIMVLN